MTHSRVAAAGERAAASGCMTTTFIDENSSLGGAEYDAYFDLQGFALPGRLLVGLSEQGASVVIDIDP